MFQIIQSTAILISLITMVSSAKILCIFPTPTYSHKAVFRPLVHELARTGHQLYVATSNPSNLNISNLVEINWDFSYESTKELFDRVSKGEFIGNRLMSWKIGHRSIREFVDKQLTDQNFKSIVEKEKFDLLIVEMVNREYNVVRYKLNVPMIGILSSEMMFKEHESMGNPTHCLLYPNDGFGAKLINKTFFERILVVAEYIFERFAYDQIYMRYSNKVARESFIFESLNIWDVDYSVDLVFVNAHPSLGFARPLVPNVVDITGIHMQRLRNMDENVLKLLNFARKGAILFSLGSTLKSELIPQKTQDILFEAFAEMPYTVIMRRSGFIKLPPNVISFEWLQQNEILAHPNVKLFIFHAGYQSMVEAVSHGVPMIAMPFCGDEFLNAQRIVHLKIGRSLNMLEITKNSFKRAVVTVIKDPKYKENADRLSKQIFDHPQTPLERAVWWTNYVLRHNGTKQLRPVVQDLALYQYLYLDLIAVFLTPPIMIGWLLFTCIKYLHCRRFKTKTE